MVTVSPVAFLWSLTQHRGDADAACKELQIDRADVDAHRVEDASFCRAWEDIVRAVDLKVQDRFLQAFAGTGDYLKACAATGLSPDLVLRVRELDPIFALGWKRRADRIFDLNLRSASAKSELELTDRHVECLQALGELQAVSEETRATGERIATKVAGPDSNPGLVKVPLAELHRAGLTNSKGGRNGGCWLTEAGMAKLETVSKQ